MTDATELREQINKLGTEMQAIVAKAREDKRDKLSDEENSKFDAMDKDREALIAQERRAIRIAELEGGSQRKTELVPPADETRRVPKGKQEITSDERMEAMRSWIQAGSDVPLTTAQQELCQRMGVVPHSKHFTLRLPRVTPRSLRDADMESWEKRALSTLTATSPEDGAYLIANEAMAPLERALLAFGGMRQASTVRRTRNGADWPIPTNDDTSNKGALLAENTIAVSKDPAFGQTVLEAYKFTSKKILVSRELMQDSNENLASLLGELLGERIGRITNDYFTTGTGTGEPRGLVTASTASGTQLAAQTPTSAEMVAIEHSVDPSYRNGAAWMFHDTMLAEMKKITDASTGRPIWLPNMAGGAPDTILGYPYFINQSMAVAAGSGAAKSILFGRLSKYWIRDVADIQLFRLDELYAEYYQVAFVAFSRHDGDLLDAGTHPVKHGLNKA